MHTKSLLRAGAAALALGLPQQAAAVFVYVTSYAGTLTTLNLTLSAIDTNAYSRPTKASVTGEASVAAVAVHRGCGPNASWLTLDKAAGILYCLDEGFNSPNGTLSSYRTSANGTLTQIQRVDTPAGPVHATLYGEGGRGLAVAEYAGSALSSYRKDPETLSEIQQTTWTLAQPGANATRQTAPHPHEVVVDPTGRFLLVPDLGADLVRVFAINQTSLAWTPLAPLVTPPGTGPRHLSFVAAPHSNKTFLYLTSELVNTVTGYELTYHANGTLSFAQVHLSSTYGPGAAVPEAASAGEILTSPDQRFVLVSTRSDHAFNISNFDRDNCTQLVSDSITTFRIDPASGRLSFVQLHPSGGLIPRQFSFNKAGTLLGVGQQGSGRVVFINRNVRTGQLTGFAAAIDIAGEVSSVVFDE